ncbi:hypothetical protein QA640_20770 [Bradyrhizobium sp. CB82]|uniref:hypothetical protein n=1 Tax=Bradyrhizobium sp. CB82 TaxID=3039159 RepID=UPI0024B05DE0|nr:hypothetical protein [Bradyrhizobium sp. CB82]WFU44666.1 hypothetical protein QA640_20770 [Bradyrhizobium sp. CB82]
MPASPSRVAQEIVAQSAHRLLHDRELVAETAGRNQGLAEIPVEQLSPRGREAHPHLPFVRGIEPEVDAEIDLNQAGSAFFLRARLNVNVPGVDRAVAQGLIEAAHGICPYSKAVHGNIDVTTTLI